LSCAAGRVQTLIGLQLTVQARAGLQTACSLAASELRAVLLDLLVAVAIFFK
jgi:hypothetical protein